MNKNKSLITNVVRLTMLTLAILAGLYMAQASTSVGTIDTVFKLTKICKDATCTAYGNVNWKPTINGSTPGALPVTITDTSITGHAWGDEIGWINLAPTGLVGADVLKVDPNTGVITGLAYSNAGSWINFAPTGAGVTIDNNGEFVGWAWVSGLNGGWMKFDCGSAATCIKTDWRPIPVRSIACSNGLDDDGDTLIDYPADPGCSSGLDTDETNSTSVTPSSVSPLTPNFQITLTPGASSTNLKPVSSATPTREIIQDIPVVEDNRNVFEKVVDYVTNTVKEVAGVTPEDKPQMPTSPTESTGEQVSNAVNPGVFYDYRQLVPIFEEEWNDGSCTWCVMMQREMQTNVVGGNLVSKEYRIIKYGFVPKAAEIGIPLGSLTEQPTDIDLISIIITIILLYIIKRYLVKGLVGMFADDEDKKRIRNTNTKNSRQ